MFEITKRSSALRANLTPKVHFKCGHACHKDIPNQAKQQLRDFLFKT